MPRNDQLDAKYIHALWTKTRDATLKMIAASNKWYKVSDELNDYLDRSEIFDIVQRTTVRKESLELQGAYSAWQFHQGNVLALSAALQTEQIAPGLLEQFTKD